MARPARALLDPRALRHNFARVKALAPGARIMAVVKANAYGHGLAWVARTLDGADAFGVACIEEGVRLREKGIDQPICALEGFFGPDELPILAHHRLSTAVHHEAQLRMLEAADDIEALSAWLKIDTGMHRLGFAPEAAAPALARLKACRSVKELRAMSHLANADNPSDAATPNQIDSFTRTLQGVALERSLANSAGVVAWPASHFEWVRPGIMLYGVSPVLNKDAAALGLRSVMTLETALIAVHQRRKGDPVGYGGDWRCPEDMRIGVAAIGYGDGYPRHAPAGTPVLVNGQPAPLVGRVSMDMITVDLRAQPQAQVGDRVVLWGDGLPVEKIAAHAGTIGYELLCHVAERIPRVEVH